ncbi:MAG: ComEA family DNA-binding protein [Steroidobacteraceae bacterium]
MRLKGLDELPTSGDPRLQFPDLTPRPWWRRIKWAIWLPIAASAIAVLSGAVWIARDALPLFGSGPPSEGSLLVNVNTATTEQLQSLPGIGPARARLIIEHRPYASVEDLKRIQAIPDTLIDDLKPLLLVSGETRKTATR